MPAGCARAGRVEAKWRMLGKGVSGMCLVPCLIWHCQAGRMLHTT
jgi:hypothetical protein